MKPYILALAAGLLVGVVYALLNVRSPAPPVIALVGLFGILIGEQLPPLAKRLFTSDESVAEALRTGHAHHVFGELTAWWHAKQVSGASDPGKDRA